MSKELIFALLLTLCDAAFFAKAAVYLGNKYRGWTGKMLWLASVFAGVVIGVLILIPHA